MSQELFSLWEKTHLDGEANKDVNIFSQCVARKFWTSCWDLYLWSVCGTGQY